MTLSHLRRVLEHTQYAAEFPCNRYIQHLRYRLQQIEQGWPRTWLVELTGDEVIAAAEALVRRWTESTAQEQATANALSTSR